MLFRSMARPKLLLLDEPSLDVAPIFIQKIARAIVQINREDEVGIILRRSLALAWRGSDNQRVLDVPRSLALGRAAPAEELLRSA